MASTSSSANPITREQTPTALSLGLPFPAKLWGLLFDSIDLTDAKCLQVMVHRLANRRSCERAEASGRCGPQPEAIPALAGFIKRCLDLLLASIAILLLWPLMLLIAIAVRLESPRGPVIYPSLRAGKRGAPFNCYKFRTMIPGANELRKAIYHLNQRKGPFFKIADDPRITRLGRFLRKYSFDELPQLWNVLKGDMSLGGPRPHPVEDVAQYGPGHEQRLEVTPGITGLWQVSARTNPSFETCVVLDIGYIRYWSLFLDFMILLRTIPAVLAGEGE